MRFQPLSVCCGINLRTAGAILGILGILISVFRLYRVLRIVGLIFGISHVPIGILAVIFTVIIIGANICWLYGLKKEKPNFMLTTIILDAIGIIFTLLSALFILIFSHDIKGDEVEKLFPVVSAVVHLLIAVPEDYFWIVEYSVYQFIKDNDDQKILLPASSKNEVPPKNEAPPENKEQISHF